MLMRCEPLNGSLSAEESVEPIPGQAEFLSARLRLCTRITHRVRPAQDRVVGPLFLYCAVSWDLGWGWGEAA